MTNDAFMVAYCAKAAGLSYGLYVASRSEHEIREDARRLRSEFEEARRGARRRKK